MNHSEIVSFIWGIADLIRDSFKRGKFQDVILPLTVLRRVDSVLSPTKEKVLETQAKLKAKKLENPEAQLKRASEFAFYNTSHYDFEKLLADAPNLAANLRNYMAGFSPNMREVFERFDFDNTITKLEEADLLFLVMERFKGVDLHPNNVDNPTMGTIFEELIRKFNEALNENPGEHFTPRDVVQLMVHLLLAGDESRIQKKGIVVTVYDPCCGSGGMLTIAKEHIVGADGASGEVEPINAEAAVHLFGQEVNPETWAVSKSDMLMIHPDGHDAENLAFGSTLSDDRHADMDFDYLITNPPYGKDWKRDEDTVRAEHARGSAGRFAPGVPRISDGQMLFLMHMLSHMKDPAQGGSRVAIIMNGSPLFTGDAGSSESEIRRWILENDWLDTIVALPEQLFYNTGIATYVWILSNRKTETSKGKVQLIDATEAWVPMPKSLGDKRRQISPEQIGEISEIYARFRDKGKSKIFRTTDFGFRKIRVERPLRLNFKASPERIERLSEETAFKNLAASKKKKMEAKAAEEQAGREQQKAILAVLEALPEDLYRSREEFHQVLYSVLESRGLKLTAALRNAIFAVLSERDDEASISMDLNGNSQPDKDLTDYENVPLGEDIEAYFEREVRPFVSDAWIDKSFIDQLDGDTGRVGYEINFNSYFYKYQPPRPLEEIEADIKELEGEIISMLKEITS